MKIVLRSDVEKLGSKGDLVEVAPGYARNYLVPRGLAMIATRGSIKQSEAMKRNREVKAKKDRDGANELAAKLNGKSFEVAAKAGATGRLFGSVTTTDVAAALANAGIDVDRRVLVLADAVKEVGEYDVSVKIHADVDAAFRIKVVAKQ